jgi:hypothetical protein
VKVGKGIFSVSGWKRNVDTVYVCMYVLVEPSKSEP